MDKLKRLQEDRDAVSMKMRDLRGKVENGFDDETRQQWDGYCDQIDKIEAEINQVKEDQRRLEREKATWNERAADERPTQTSAPEVITGQTRSLALKGWLAPESKRTAAQYEAMQRVGMNPHAREMTLSLSPNAPKSAEDVRRNYGDDAQKRAQGVGTGSAGGNLVNNELIAAFDEALLYYCNLREVATVLRTETGADLPIPTMNDTSQKGEIPGENTQVSSQDVTLGQVTMKAYNYSSKAVLVSYEFLNDAYLNVDAWLGRVLGERIGRIQTEHFTTGDNSSKPQGIVTGAANSSVTLAGAAAVTYANLVDIFHSVDPEYRMMPNCAWMLHDTWLKYIRKIVDANGDPIWNPGIVGAAPSTILGKPYKINNEMPTATATKVLLFGDMSKYYIRDVAMEWTLVRLDERYADYGQVGFLSWLRSDGRIVNAGTGPIKYATAG